MYKRQEDEVFIINGKRVCREGTKAINPSFDVTPHELITGIITEEGIVKENYEQNIKKLFSL